MSDWKALESLFSGEGPVVSHNCVYPSAFIIDVTPGTVRLVKIPEDEGWRCTAALHYTPMRAVWKCPSVRCGQGWCTGCVRYGVPRE